MDYFDYAFIFAFFILILLSIFDFIKYRKLRSSHEKLKDRYLQNLRDLADRTKELEEIKKSPPQLTHDAQKMLAEMISGGAVLHIEVLDKESIYYHKQ